MDIINEFIEQYKKEYDYYSKLATLAQEECERALYSRGIKAIVSSRAKKIDSLEEKLRKRNKEKIYTSINDINDDICDFSGVRIALYFPNEREPLDKVINEIFQVTQKKSFPEQKQQPNHKKRFSGYWANHYRIKLKGEHDLKRYNNTIIEIQVASVLMHAWSEIEHDLIYKPADGQVSENEFQILDEINGLVMVGEIALERLNQAMIERSLKKRRLDDNYDIKNYITKNIKSNSKDIGDLNTLYDFLLVSNKLTKSEIKKSLVNIEFDNKSTITNDIIENIFYNYSINNNDYTKVLSDYALKNKNNINISYFERFIKIWILVEKSIEKLDFIKDDKRYLPHNLKVLKQTGILSLDEYSTLSHCRKFRNEILHGNNELSDDYLYELSHSLYPIVEKLIKNIDDRKIRTPLEEILNKLK